MNRKQKNGIRGEELVAQKLWDKGWTILARRYRIPQIAEVDILARGESRIWLVEVKTHEEPAWGSLLSPEQLRRLERARNFVARGCPNCSVHLVLAWVKLSCRRVEFLEIP